MALHRKQAVKNILERVQCDLGLPGILKEQVSEIIYEELEDWDFFPKNTVLPHMNQDEVAGD